jgi:hypothetical protein
MPTADIFKVTPIISEQEKTQPVAFTCDECIAFKHGEDAALREHLLSDNCALCFNKTDATPLDRMLQFVKQAQPDKTATAGCARFRFCLIERPSKVTTLPSPTLTMIAAADPSPRNDARPSATKLSGFRIVSD